jgi:hypothetical protein
MNLTKERTDRVLLLWQAYVDHGEKFLNASQEFTQQKLDQKRREVIPEVILWLNRFLSGDVALEEFKTVNDGINKRNRLWGFQAINGQMFFNVLTKNSLAGNRREEFVQLLKKSLPVPETITEAKTIIEQFARFTKELGQYSADLRGAPKVGSIPYFLSYFWQIQQPEIYPIYYTSMVNVLVEQDIWIPSGEVAEDYRVFYDLNHTILPLLSKVAGRPLHLWDLEHALWFNGQMQNPAADSAVKSDTVTITATSAKNDEKTLVIAKDEISESYIPPIVAILPRLAVNDAELAKHYQSTGRAIEKIFEEKLATIFRMLGYETQLLGQGQGRVPDGIAVSQEFRYAIIYDAKVRQNPYTMGTDERAIREYISIQGERLRKQGMRNLYFMVISSAFTGDHDDAIRTLKIDTNVNEVLLVEVKSLLAMLEGKLRNPNVSLGPDGIQRLLAASGLLTESNVREFLEI